MATQDLFQRIFPKWLTGTLCQYNHHMGLSQIDLADYPDLAQPFRWKWGPIDASFELLDEIPGDELISNVRIVPFVGEQVVILKMDDGQWNHPGGTLEPGEPYVETARRELVEEAGAKLLSLKPFGLIRCHSYAEKPFRPHMAHPDFFQIVVTADVELVSEPTNPAEENEQTVSVQTLSLGEAVERFKTREDGGAWMADMYRLGAKVRESG